MDSNHVISYVGSAASAVGCTLLLMAPFSSRYRRAPRWIRSGFFLAAPLGIIWGVLGIYLAAHQTRGPTDPNWPQFWHIHFVHTSLGGMALGILISLAISPDLYKRWDRVAPKE